MSDEAARAREQLAAEAARLEAKRAKELDDQRRREAREAAARPQQRALARPGHVRAAMSRGLYMWFLFTIVTFYVFMVVMHDGGFALRGWQLASTIVVAVATLGLAGHRATGVRRLHRWLARLPFPIEGLGEALGLDRAISTAQVTIRFRGASISRSQIAELVGARVPAPDEDKGADVAALGDGSIRITAAFSSEAANWPFANWVRKLVNRVLVDVARGYPIAEVRVEVLDTCEFHVPSGD